MIITTRDNTFIKFGQILRSFQLNKDKDRTTEGVAHNIDIDLLNQLLKQHNYEIVKTITLNNGYEYIIARR